MESLEKVLGLLFLAYGAGRMAGERLREKALGPRLQRLILGSWSCFMRMAGCARPGGPRPRPSTSSSGP